jgi:hypothetical protein
MKQNKRVLLSLLLLLPLSMPLYAQQLTLAAAGSMSSGGIACTVSIGEVFRSVSVPSDPGEEPPDPGVDPPEPGVEPPDPGVEPPAPSGGGPSLSPGVTHPATKHEIDASSNGNPNANVPLTTAGSDIRAFYDPSSQTVRIFAGETSGEPRTCRVYAMTGVLLYAAPLHAGRETAVPLNGPAPGVYILRITAGNISKTVKLIKTR